MITKHHDGHGLNEQICIFPLEDGELAGSNTAHRYSFSYQSPGGESAVEIGYLQFQKGPRNVEGSTPGLTANAVLAALVDHLRRFQAGPYASRQTACAITKLEEAMHWIRDRADERARRGVLGTYQK